MATAKAQTMPMPADSTGTAALAQFPPRISLDSTLLASVIDLPHHPSITYSVFKPVHSPTSSDSLGLIDNARKQILKYNESLDVVGSILPSVSIVRDSSALYLFAIGHEETSSASVTALKECIFDGLYLNESHSFTQAALYPCSVECSMLRDPCPMCLNAPDSPSSSDIPKSTTAATFLPRQPLRRPLTHFLQALRDRLIDDIVEASKRPHGNAPRRPVVRYRGGFLLTPASLPVVSEWKTGWEHHARQRSLVYCELHTHLGQSRVLVHPILRPTHLLPLGAALPLPAGSPITLLPHGVPAYYLNTYTGSVGALTAHFECALAGLGAGEWKDNGSDAPVYVIVWVAVQNKQGEDKGIPVIWPMRLCAAFTPTHPHPRPSLAYIPSLPSQLQNSPPPLPSQGSTTRFSSIALTTAITASAAPSPRTDPVALTISRRATPAPIDNHDSRLAPLPERVLPSQPMTPLSDSLRALRTLTLSNTGVRTASGEVSEYVDAVAKERERERERMKREREGSSSKMSSGQPKQEDKSSPEMKASPITPVAGPLQELKPSVSNLGTQQHLSLGSKPEPDSPAIDKSVASSVTVGSMPPETPSSLHSVHDVLPTTVTQPPEPEPEPAPPPRAPVPSARLAVTTAVPVPPPPVAASFDPFSGFDSSWTQNSNEFMNMDMPIDMSMSSLGGIAGMGFSLGMGGNNDGIETDRFGIEDDGFGVFTDDDFNFFDAPSAQSRVPVGSAGAGLTPVVGPAPLSFSPPVTGDTTHTLGSGLPSAISHHHPAHWENHMMDDLFTPQSSEPPSLPTPGIGIPPASDFVPMTPGQTPPSHSTSQTPIETFSEHDLLTLRKVSFNASGGHGFEPIPFAASHTLADGKYAKGKFALPSPPDEEDRTQPIPKRPTLSHFSTISRWKHSYNEATDPRVGLIRRLVGVKRKRFGTDQGGREGKMSPVWVREDEEWASYSPRATPPDLEDTRSVSESEEEEDPKLEDDYMPCIARPQTPPPAYLPQGPTLIQTLFHHSCLLPLSTPLRPPGASVQGLSIGSSTFVSAPTPVSPAAVLGAASEKTKSLEAAAQILAKEVVENCVWADAWQANTSAATGVMKEVLDVSSGDAKLVAHLLGNIHGLTINTVFDLADSDGNHDSDYMKQLEQPLLSVGKLETIIQVLPTALRFWEKLGLSPRTGSKNVVAYAFFEAGSDEKEEQVSHWIHKMSVVYMTKNFGQHTVGKSPGCVKDGLVPAQFDTIRKTIVSFAANLPKPDDSIIFYIITPARIVGLSSPILRQVFSAIKKVHKTYPESQILFHFVPEPLLLGMDNPAMSYSGLELLADAVYDRVLQVAQRMMSRKLRNDESRVRAFFQEPAFTLARPLQPNVQFRRESYVNSLDVLDRHSLLHIGYLVTPCGKWLLAACIDQRGEAHDLRAWLIPAGSDEFFVVNNVWTFVLGIALRANVEWRVVIAKLGTMKGNEVATWLTQLDTALSPIHEPAPMQVSILSADQHNPWTLLPPRHINTLPPTLPYRGGKNVSDAVFADVSQATYAIYLTSPLTPFHSYESSTDLAYIPDMEDERPSDDDLDARPLLANTILCIPAGTSYSSTHMLHLNLFHTHRSPHSSSAISDEDTLHEVSQNYHELAVLAKVRWKLRTNPVLPFHLAALEIVHAALDRGDSMLD